MHSSVTTNLLHRGGFNLEVRHDITTEYSRLQRLDVSTNIGLRGDQMPFVHCPVGLFVPVRHDDLPSERFHLKQCKFRHTKEAWRDAP